MSDTPSNLSLASLQITIDTTEADQNIIMLWIGVTGTYQWHVHLQLFLFLYNSFEAKKSKLCSAHRHLHLYRLIIFRKSLFSPFSGLPPFLNSPWMLNKRYLLKIINLYQQMWWNIEDSNEMFPDNFHIHLPLIQQLTRSLQFSVHPRYIQ